MHQRLGPLKGRTSEAPVQQPEIVASKFPGVTVICVRKMASVSVAAAAAAAAVAAANRDPAVDRSLRSVFGKLVDHFYPHFFLKCIFTI